MLSGLFRSPLSEIPIIPVRSDLSSRFELGFLFGDFRFEVCFASGLFPSSRSSLKNLKSRFCSPDLPLGRKLTRQRPSPHRRSGRRHTTSRSQRNWFAPIVGAMIWRRVSSSGAIADAASALLNAMGRRHGREKRRSRSNLIPRRERGDAGARQNCLRIRSEKRQVRVSYVNARPNWLVAAGWKPF